MMLLLLLVGDVVELKNGDRITGTVVGVDKGVLTMTTEYAKEIKIELAKVKSITTSKPATVELADGEILKGTLSAGADGKLVVTSEVAGKSAEIDLAKVSRINPPEEVPAKFRGSVGIGALVARGNTDRIAVTVAADAERKTDDDRLSFRFLWNYAEDDGVRSARNVFAGLKYDYFFSKWVYAYVTGELYSDEFKDLDLRAIGTVGLGWLAVDKEDYDLSFEAGVAYVSNNFDEGEDNAEVAARLAMQVVWKITEGVTFKEHLVMYPLREEGEWLARNELSLLVALGDWLGGKWGLKFSNVLDYDSEPSGDRERLDVLWLLSLQYAFGT
jgi:putative salt-induced outer membrane protein YdiY/small nuclear ribonucleoprotein (snRNP)-like protein